MIIRVRVPKADSNRGIGVREGECKKRNEGALPLLKKHSYGGATKPFLADFCLFSFYFRHINSWDCEIVTMESCCCYS